MSQMWRGKTKQQAKDYLSCIFKMKRSSIFKLSKNFDQSFLI